MEINVYEYVIEKLRNNEKVNIEIIGKKSKDDWLEMDWLIDKKLLLKDFPFEVFEGEVVTKIVEEATK